MIVGTKSLRLAQRRYGAFWRRAGKHFPRPGEGDAAFDLLREKELGFSPNMKGKMTGLVRRGGEVR